MTEYAKEPWKIGSSPAGKSVIFLVGDEPEHTLGPDENWIDCNTEANARRIVACVNACEGLTTEYLETDELPEFVGKTLCADLAQQEIDRVTTQHDQLLAALEAIIDLHDSARRGSDVAVTIANARAAIAAVKG